MRELASGCRPVIPSSPPEKSGKAKSSPMRMSGNASVASERYEPRRRGGGGTSAPSALLLEGHAEEAFGTDEEDDHHDRQRHRALEEGPLRQHEDGDRLDVPDHQGADDAAVDAAESTQHDDGEHGD